MSINYQVQQKIYRLETLRKYQAYYGPNTPYQIVAEINQLEAELRRMLEADLTRPTPAASGPRQSARERKSARPKAKRRRARKATPSPKAPVRPKKKSGATGKKRPTKKRNIFGLSRATVDIILTIAFIGLLFFLGAVVFVTYIQTRSGEQLAFNQQFDAMLNIQPTLRPTFTPTADPNNPAAPPPEQPAEESAPPPQGIEVAAIDNPDLPSAVKEATPVPTPVPTLTPKPAPDPTDTPTPLPTEPPPPTSTLPPPPPVQPTATPAPPTNTPAPSFRFNVKEQGNREFQYTNYHIITVYIAIVSQGNVPIGGLKVVGDHVPSGMHIESGLSDWNWSATNCLDCDYIKFGNLKFEPGPFIDGTWNIYVADPAGNQLSPVVPLTYSSDPNQWVWDFVLFSE